ncbi:hypothetical protein KY312_01935, partial [Candidatus Woesearchaeota archaeon]|nr:hypothetical protein [Candidatus Woesearchaeota archaeon]
MNKINQILDLIDEVETQLRYKRRLVLAVNEAEKDYQRKKYNYDQYEKKLSSILKEKSLKDWVDYYNTYALNLLERIKYLNTQIFYNVYHGLAEQKPAPTVEKEEIVEPVPKFQPETKKKPVIQP